MTLLQSLLLTSHYKLKAGFSKATEENGGRQCENKMALKIVKKISHLNSFKFNKVSVNVKLNYVLFLIKGNWKEI